MLWVWKRICQKSECLSTALPSKWKKYMYMLLFWITVVLVRDIQWGTKITLIVLCTRTIVCLLQPTGIVEAV